MAMVPTFSSKYFKCTVITVRKRSLRQCNIFRSVCQSFCPQGGGVMMSLAVMDSTTPRQHLPNPPPGQQAVGTHPTGMLSCLISAVTLTGSVLVSDCSKSGHFTITKITLFMYTLLVQNTQL